MLVPSGAGWSLARSTALLHSLAPQIATDCPSFQSRLHIVEAYIEVERPKVGWSRLMRSTYLQRYEQLMVASSGSFNS